MPADRQIVIDETITIHSTWRGICGGLLGAAGILGAGAFGVAHVGFRVLPTIILVVGLFLSTVMLGDFPVSSRFTPVGVERRMLLRRQWFDWEEVKQLSRARPSIGRLDRGIEHGGLALVQGRRRYLLVDRLESCAEFERMVEVVDSGASDVGTDMLLRPGAKVPPTWLYRRRRWRPDS
jgi:hypothetical protein